MTAVIWVPVIARRVYILWDLIKSGGNRFDSIFFIQIFSESMKKAQYEENYFSLRVYDEKEYNKELHTFSGYDTIKV